MTTKAIAILSDHPEAKLIVERIKQREKFFDKQIEALEEKAKEHHENMMSQNNPDREELINMFRNKLPEDFSEEKYCIHFDLEKGVVEYHEKDDVPPFLKAIFGHLH